MLRTPRDIREQTPAASGSSAPPLVEEKEEEDVFPLLNVKQKEKQEGATKGSNADGRASGSGSGIGSGSGGASVSVNVDEFSGSRGNSNLSPFSGKRSTKSGSKYDYVKVRVWLGDKGNQHYYVLSRFLLARMLTASKVPKKKATQIMLELKKTLVDENRLDISQKELEKAIFALLESNGYHKEYVECFGMITSFYHLKIPLIVILCGTACVGKSMVATRLAERLNLPNVLQTDLFVQIIRMSEGSPIHPLPLWERVEDFDHDPVASAEASESEAEAADEDKTHSILREFKRECACVRKSVQGDLKKSIVDGKSIILEGTYLDPVMFNDLQLQLIDEEEGSSRSMAQTFPSGRERGRREGEEGEEDRNKTHHEGHPNPIVVPVVLAMERDVHLDALDQWMEYSVDCDRREKGHHLNKEQIHQTLSFIQTYYLKYAKRHPGTLRCWVNPMRIQDTVDELHSHLLKSITLSMQKRR